MQLIKETNLYDDEAINRKVEEINESIEAVNARVVSTYGKCTTSANVAAKVVSLADFVLYTGARITVQFTYANTVANPTLNVNGTGAKPIWARNAAIIEQYYWSAQSRVDFIYDGDHWTMPNAKTQEELFDELTNNGAIRGIFMQNNQMYVNMDYLKTGTAKIGGSGDVNGLLEVYNASSTVTCRLNNAGLYAIAGTIGNFAIGSSNLHNGMTSLSDTTHNGVYVGTDGIALGKGAFKVTSAGAVTASNITVTGGSVSGNVITAGKIQSANGEVYFDLTNNKLACNEMVGYSSHLLINRFSSNGVYYTYSDYYRYSAATGINIIPPVNSTEWGGISCSNGLRLTSSAASSYLTETVPMVRIGTTSVSDTVKIQANSNSYIAIKANPGSAAAVLIESSNSVRVDAPLYVYGSLTVTGTKPRLVTTQDYSQRYLYCYETPSPLFGDVGEGTIMEDGKCYIWIDSIFAETVSLNQYQVFLQKYGDGDCWVEEKTSAYFVVSGTAGLQFGWEIKAKQSDFDQCRLERFDEQINSNNEIDYANELLEHIADIQHEREVAA